MRLVWVALLVASTIAGGVEPRPVDSATIASSASQAELRELIWERWSSSTALVVRFPARDRHTGQVVDEHEIEIEVDAYGVSRLTFRYQMNERGEFEQEVFFDELQRLRYEELSLRERPIAPSKDVSGQDYVLVFLMHGERRQTL